MAADMAQIDIADAPPTSLHVQASDILDASNGLHFREWTHPGGQCYRWSGAAPTVRLPLRIDRSMGNIICVDVMRAFSDRPDFRLLIDGRETPVDISTTDDGIKLEAHVPAAGAQTALIVEIVSRMAAEDATTKARRLGFAFIGAHLITGTP